MKTIVKTIATTTLALGLFGTPAFASGGRGASFDFNRKSTCGMNSETVVKSSLSGAKPMQSVVAKSGPVNR
jgi:hypothetical protein